MLVALRTVLLPNDAAVSCFGLSVSAWPGFATKLAKLTYFATSAKFTFLDARVILDSQMRGCVP